jgi:phosphatidylglycerophosphate synthase
MSANKLPAKYDDAIDIHIKKWIDVIHPSFKKAGFTPNMITTLSFLLGLISCYLYYVQYYALSAVCYGMSYFFDTMDGYFARLYNMGSTFGSYYDSATDIIVITLLGILLLTNRHISNGFKLGIVMLNVGMGIGMAYHMSCQEKYVESTNPTHKSKGLSFLDPIQCYDYDHMKTSRYFGSGPLCITVMTCILIHLFLAK